MPYSYITTGNDYHREPILSGLDEQPLDNDTKEGIYLSTRLVEKQRLEDAKMQSSPVQSVSISKSSGRR